MALSQERLNSIGDTIRAVAAAESGRYFKTENNTYERSKFVYHRIKSAINLALLDLGTTQHMVYLEIDTTDAVLAQMVKDGYVIPASVSQQSNVW
jgi:hypothetical protein